MNDQPRFPDPETRRHCLEKIRQCRQLDALNLLADEATIAQAEADICNSHLTAYRLGRQKH